MNMRKRRAYNDKNRSLKFLTLNGNSLMLKKQHRNIQKFDYGFINSLSFSTIIIDVLIFRDQTDKLNNLRFSALYEIAETKASSYYF